MTRGTRSSTPSAAHWVRERGRRPGPRRATRAAAARSAWPGIRPVVRHTGNLPTRGETPRMANDSTRLAVLIDADNTSAKLIGEMFEELAGYGTLTVKRAYGDWTNPHLNGWRDVLLGNAISPQQQFAYTYGKNATDSALIIDAMDLLYSGNVEGFAIVSSDSDFTPLATRLRESGKRVIGVGRRTTPKAFVEACERFLFLEVLGGDSVAAEQTSTPTRGDQPPS